MFNPATEIEKAIEAIRQHAPEHLQEAFVSLLRPAITLKVNRAEDSGLPIGCSKFGGAPDLPLKFEWPSWDNKPLDFLAQINLQQIAPYDVESIFPNNGLLSFFVSVEGERWCVQWFDDFDFLKRSTIQHRSLSQTCSIIPSFHLELLHFSERAFCEISGWEHNWDEFYKLLDLSKQFYPTFSPDYMNKMLGYAQGTDGIIEPPEYDENGKKLSPPPQLLDWHVLLQVDSDFTLDVCWCDAGIIHCMISKQALATRRFEKARFTLSNH